MSDDPRCYRCNSRLRGGVCLTCLDLDAMSDSARQVRDRERAAARTSRAERPLRPLEPFVPTADDIRYDAALDDSLDRPHRR